MQAYSMETYKVDFWNKLDLLIIVINFLLIYSHFDANRGQESYFAKSVFVFAAISVFAMWAKMFYWLRLYK